MKKLQDVLDRKLLTQPFAEPLKNVLGLNDARLIAQLYARLENSISVLSDMKMRCSYVYYGAIAKQIGLKQQETEIDSIWEEELFGRIHPEDLQRKFRLELQYFHMLEPLPPNERSDYEVVTKLRIRHNSGAYMAFKHRLLYISSLADGSAWLALCLYNAIPDHSGFNIPDGVIVNNRTGEVIVVNNEAVTTLLSQREKQVLQLIKHGYKSKVIASRLSLSINTVNRHRQNIFEKLNVSNALEACWIAEATGMIT